MSKKTMYPGINNSPMTALDGDLSATATTIPIVAPSALPDAPNVATIGTGDDAELVLYTGKTSAALTGCTRGFNGTTAKAWNGGEYIYRAFTAYDYDTIRENLEELYSIVDPNTGTVMHKGQYDPEGLGVDVYAYADGAADNKKYGVSGVGGSSTTLTRLWDAVGKTAAVGTDAATAENDFDEIAPFNRRKCVGRWSDPDENGLAHFTVNAYEGDPDYTEDGTKGDFVAVDVEPFWYYQDLASGVIGVSKTRHAGWKIHPVCKDKFGNTRAHTYLPAYMLAYDGAGHAVSLPGFHPVFGHYRTLRAAARTYNGGNTAAILEPFAVRHYEWLLFTIEFATTNCQSIMNGPVSMAYAAGDKVSMTASNTNSVVCTAAIGDKFVVGQTIYLGTTHSTTPSNTDAYNVVTAIDKCDADGTLNASGTYRRITFDGTARSVTANTTTISSRPWKTGGAAEVKTPSGSAVSNSDGKHPFRYRWRENLWGNIYSTCNDLFADLAGSDTEEDPYHLIWYRTVNPDYYPSSSSKPDRTDLAGSNFRKLSQTTEHVSNYIKVMEADDTDDEFIVPTVQTGGSASTYYADYAYIVNGTTGVRAVRLGGGVANGAYFGLLYFNAGHPVSSAGWYCGGGLYFNQ